MLRVIFLLDLTNADLTAADFTDADLSNADFKEADLRGTNFTNANLTNANLTGASVSKTTILKGANRSYAAVSGVDLSEVRAISSAKFIGVDLQTTKLPTFLQN